VLFIYRLILRRFDFLGWLAPFGTTPIVRFWGPCIAFTDAYDMKVFVSRYHSIDMHCIVLAVLAVKFDGRLSI
jgi:hypothetical protein